LDLIEIFPVNISITRVSLAYALKVSGGRKDRQRIRRDANLALYDSFAVITPAPLKAAQEVTMSTPTERLITSLSAQDRQVPLLPPV
jgi:hypothetical protein